MENGYAKRRRKEQPVKKLIAILYASTTQVFKPQTAFENTHLNVALVNSRWQQQQNALHQQSQPTQLLTQLNPNMHVWNMLLEINLITI